LTAGSTTPSSTNELGTELAGMQAVTPTDGPRFQGRKPLPVPDALAEARREGGAIMYARKGDRIVVRSQHLVGPVRDGEIIAVEHEDGSPPYRVRWSDDGHESLFFPSSDAYIDHGDVPAPWSPDNS
jgi:hypothetical protein